MKTMLHATDYNQNVNVKCVCYKECVEAYNEKLAAPLDSTVDRIGRSVVQFNPIQNIVVR